MTTPTWNTAHPSPIDLAMLGWQQSRVLMAANYLDFFTLLGDESLTAAELAARAKTHPRSTEMLLNACVAIGAMEKDGQKFRNTVESEEKLVRGKPGYVGSAIAHEADLWIPWGHLQEAVANNQRVELALDQVPDPAVLRNFIMAMHDRALPIAAILAETLDLTGRKELLDAGGGPGTFSIFFAKRYPELKTIVFDLRRTLEITKEVVAEFGMSDRVSLMPGHFWKTDLGQGHDVVFLSSILHSMSPETSKKLLDKAFQSLVPGGIVVVHERLLNEDGTSPIEAVLFSLNMLINTGEGQSYKASELKNLMKESGFVKPRVQHLPEKVGTSLVIGTKP